MYLNNASYAPAVATTQKSGSNLPLSRTSTPSEASKTESIRDLAKSIDPSSMSRNEAREMADMLMQSGEADLSIVFFSHSLVLIPTGDGSYRNAEASDPVMNEKFNMFEAIRSNIAFKESKGLSVENEEAALAFLEKFKLMAENPQLDTYA